MQLLALVFHALGPHQVAGRHLHAVKEDGRVAVDMRREGFQTYVGSEGVKQVVVSRHEKGKAVEGGYHRHLQCRRILTGKTLAFEPRDALCLFVRLSACSHYCSEENKINELLHIFFVYFGCKITNKFRHYENIWYFCAIIFTKQWQKTR